MFYVLIGTNSYSTTLDMNYLKVRVKMIKG